MLTGVHVSMTAIQLVFLCLSRQSPHLIKLEETNLVARSSTEVEYKALSTFVAEAIWIQIVLCELSVSLSYAPTFYFDNINVNYLSTNPVFHSKMKHMDIDIHFIYDQVATK